MALLFARYLVPVALLVPAFSASAQLGVNLSAAKVVGPSVMGNPKAVPSEPVTIPIPPEDCKDIEELTFKGGAFICVPRQASSGGGTSFVPGNGLQLSNGVLSLTNAVEDRSGTDSPIAAGDNSKTILVGQHTYTLPQAGIAGITDGWGLCFANQTDSSTATVKTVTSKFTGAPGLEASEMKLPPKQAVCLTAWRGNYNTIMIR